VHCSLVISEPSDKVGQRVRESHFPIDITVCLNNSVLDANVSTYFKEEKSEGG
jgi:hypothetical protein